MTKWASLYNSPGSCHPDRRATGPLGDPSQAARCTPGRPPTPSGPQRPAARTATITVEAPGTASLEPRPHRRRGSRRAGVPAARGPPAEAPPRPRPQDPTPAPPAAGPPLRQTQPESSPGTAGGSPARVRRPPRAARTGTARGHVRRSPQGPAPSPPGDRGARPSRVREAPRVRRSARKAPAAPSGFK